MDNAQRDHLLALRQTYLRRLRVLEEQAALSGKDIWPEVSIEIENLRAKIAEFDQQLGETTTC
jgi:hypothetical protein